MALAAMDRRKEEKERRDWLVVRDEVDRWAATSFCVQRGMERERELSLRPVALVTRI